MDPINLWITIGSLKQHNLIDDLEYSNLQTLLILMQDELVTQRVKKIKEKLNGLVYIDDGCNVSDC